MIRYLWAKVIKKIRGSAIINSSIHKTSKVESGCHIVNSKFGRYSFCGYDCSIVNCDIGAFCSIASNVSIGGANHPIQWISMSPVFYEGRDSLKTKFATHKRPTDLRTTIGNDVWIGERALIKQGVAIGDGVVIGMGSVVTKDVENFSIVAGCPAKQIGKRFDNEDLQALVDLKWWFFDDENLKKYAELIPYPKKFISELKGIENGE